VKKRKVFLKTKIVLHQSRFSELEKRASGSWLFSQASLYSENLSMQEQVWGTCETSVWGNRKDNV